MTVTAGDKSGSVEIVNSAGPLLADPACEARGTHDRGQNDKHQLVPGPLAALLAIGDRRAAGFRPRRHRLGGPESLTISERRFADLAAVGNSNRASAHALFITTKTVELQLINTYRKLGITRRSELLDRLTVT